MSTSFAEPSTIEPAALEHLDLERLSGFLNADHSAEARGGGMATTRLIGPDGAEVQLPASAFKALKLVAGWMAAGRTINLVPSGTMLTTQDVADMLGVSRTHVVNLLNAGAIPFEQPGVHRKIRIEDVMAYRRERAAHRAAGLSKIARLSEDSAGGYE
ncbi:MAG: helix-turn-helix domain-containing protein [Thermoleophilia bacterium]|nr:helix-turn-helix domain-containing protein [Thermoleophilia bacterium]